MNADKKPLVQISQFMKISTFQPQTSVIKVNEVEVEHLSKNSINVDSESNFLGLFSTQSVSPGSSSKVSTVVHDTKDNIYKPEGEYLTVINNVHQVSDVSCITSPDKLAFSATSDTKDCPHFDSVNSYNHKKRRLKLHNTSYPKLDSSNSSFSESTFKLGFPLGISTPQINDLSTKHCSQDINKVGIDLSRTQYQYIPPLDVSEEMELRVCCLSCKNNLGLPENRFLIKSFMMQSSKIYLSYIWKYGTLHSPKPDCLSNTQRMNLHILIFDTTFMNERILKEPTKKEFSHQGVWCEEDGCVFRTIFCPFCIAGDTCLGVHVLAADASNVNLLNKVILYEDRLCVSNESKAFSEGVLPNCGNLLNEGSDQGENERHTCSTLLEKPGKPATIKANTDSPRSWSVDDARYVSKVESFRPDYSSRLKVNSAKEHADNHQRRHVDFEKFAYKSQEKHDSPQAFPLNSQCVQKQIANSKLRLPRHR